MGCSFGSVYKVLDKHNKIVRAMKVISKETISYQDDEKIFLKEILIQLQNMKQIINTIIELKLDCYTIRT